GGLKGGIGAPGFYHALTAEAGGSNPSRTFSYYVGLMGFNQHFPYGNFQNQSNINPAGFSKYGLVADNEFATLNAALTCGINAGCPDGGNYANQFSNGPFAPCNNTTGVPNGYSAANPGPFNGACRGYGPFGNGYLSDEYERDNVINLHFAVPHKHDGGRDDIQLLFDNSMQYQINASSINDNGGLAYINGQLAPFATADCGGGTPCGSFTGSGAPYTGPYAGLCGYENLENVGCAQINSPLPYIDSHIFAPGTQFGQPAATAKVIPYYFPNSPTNRPLNTPLAPVSGLPTSLRDGSWNDVNIVKAQYTKNFGSNAFARLLGYTFYSDWMISGPTCAATGYFDGFLNGGLCGNTADYELPTHTRGAELLVADQINAKNLLQFNANYTTASVTRFNNSSWEAGIAGSRTGVTNLTNGDPNNPICYSYVTGAQASCFSSSTYGTYTDPERAGACAARISAGKTPCAAIPAGAQWLVTVPGGQGTYNTVKPIFTSASLQDEFKPTDRLDLNFGVRFENYTYDLANTNTPEFNFWFNEGAQVNCYDPATGLPMITPLGPGQPVPPSPVQTAPGASCGLAPSKQPGVHPTGGKGPNSGSLLYSAASPSSYSHTLFSPRVSGTYALSPDSVLRFSAGRYTQPTETAFEQYGDQSGKRAAAFNFSQFWGLGFFTPGHDNPVQTSNNFDFSFEHHFHNTDVTMKLSPFYRYTQHEIVSLVLGPGFVSGVNVGTQKSAGVELAIQKGDPSRDGWAGQLSYTYTNAKIKYGNLPNGTNGIDYLNNYVKAFNGLTKAGGGAPCYTPTFDTSGNFTGGAADASCANTADVKNPYYNMNQQGLLDRNGWYDTYPNEPPNDPTDQGGTSAIAPHTFAGYVQYKRGRFSIAPNFELIAGSYYGSPTDTYGVDPRACSQNQAAATDALGNNILPAGSQYAQNPDFLSCGGSSFVQSGYLAIPNPYTGSMDSVGQFQEPWQFNLGALIKYQVSNKVTLNLTLANIVNTCFGGTKTAWQKAFAPNNYVCGYSSNPLGTGNQTYIGPQSGQPGFGGGFFYGANGNDPVNGGQAYSPTYNYPFAPFSGALPFQAYVELQVKL
ncbi:MAG: TonB-dependent receptor domain-containing protein, partial [Vulcanimicrobiaceae bacterium]